jgi:formamidopyrimidine-DNA glycosylase
MPELPEVQTIKLQLQKYLVGHRIESIEIKNSKLFPEGKNEVTNTRVRDIRRFGKVLVIDCDNGNSMIIHIKLTGQLVYRGPNLKNPQEVSKKVSGGLGGPHTHVIFHLDKEGTLYYNDIRRFGWIKVVKTSEVLNFGFIKKLGPEPYAELTEEKFREILAKSNRPIKVVLMDQEKIGGIGNIYANDALWDAQIYPGTKAKSVSVEKAKELYSSVLKVLEKGMKYGGASELAFVTPDGTEGQYQMHTLVYGKQGTLCARCNKEKIKKTTLGGRGTYFCPNCQHEEA